MIYDPLTCLKMALFCRVNTHVFPLLSNYYWKSLTTLTRSKKNLKQPQNAAEQISVADQEISKKDAGPKLQIKAFEDVILQKRRQASRSILVQVQSCKSGTSLKNYCARFGSLSNMYYFTANHQNFFLVEFHHIEDVTNILNNSTVVKSNCFVPTKVPVLWFRKSKNSIPTTALNDVYIKRYNFHQKETNAWHSLINADSISTQIEHLYKSLQLSDLEIRLRFHIASQIEYCLSGLFPCSTIQLFGSSLNTFGRTMCDLDLVLSTNSSLQKNSSNGLVFHTKNTKHEARMEIQIFMSLLADMMNSFIPGIFNVRKILHARVPIIKFNHAFTGIDCDLTVSNLTALHMTNLLYLLGNMNNKVKPLVFVVRKWALDKKLISSSPGRTITNFPLTLLVLFYLQQEKILPPIKIFKEHAKISKDSEEEFINNLQKINLLVPSRSLQTLEDLLCGFFEFYAIFDFYKKSICLWNGVTERKEDNSAIYISNPLERSSNVCKNVSHQELERIRACMKDSLFLLETQHSMSGNWGILSILNYSQPKDVPINANELYNDKSESLNAEENDTNEFKGDQ